MRVLDAGEVRAAMTVGRATHVLRGTIRGGFDPADDLPRGRAPIPGGEFLLMPSAAGGHAGVKVLTIGGRPWVQGAYLLFDGDSLGPVAVLDGAALTDIRTPAVSFAGILDVVRARREGALRMAVVGSGPQAVQHAAGAVELFGDDGPVEVTFVVRTEREVDCPVPHRVSTALPEGMDLIVCATNAAEPVIDSADVADHAVVVAMGAHDPARRELPGDMMGRARVIVEEPHVAATECGDVMLAVDEGHLEAGDWVTLRDVVRDGSVAADLAGCGRPVVFKTAGMSWEDLAVAVEIVHNGRHAAQ